MKAKTTEQLIKYLKPAFDEWIHRPDSMETFKTKPEGLYSAYLSEEKTNPKRVFRASEKLSHWHLRLYETTALNEGVSSFKDLALSARYGIAAARFCEALVPVFPRNPPILLWPIAAQYMAFPVICGWQKEARLMTQVILKGIKSPLLNGEDMSIKGLAFEKHPWFILQLLCDWQGIALHPDDNAYPDSMSPYNTPLAKWQTPDLAEVDQMVSILADFHLAQSYEHDEASPEFEFHNDWLFPYEILTMLRLREFIGLANPAEFSHPLMQQRLGQLPPVLDVPETPLLDQVVKKFVQEYPDTFKEMDFWG